MPEEHEKLIEAAVRRQKAIELAKRVADVYRDQTPQDSGCYINVCLAAIERAIEYFRQTADTVILDREGGHEPTQTEKSTRALTLLSAQVQMAGAALALLEDLPEEILDVGMELTWEGARVPGPGGGS